MGNLASYVGCSNPLVVLFAVLIVGIILVESIHTIGSTATRQAEAEFRSIASTRAPTREGNTFITYHCQG